VNERYLRVAELLVRVAPTVFHDGRMALKGGTALNLFLRDMPRLSVDLDLTFVDGTRPRAEALACISEDLRSATQRLNDAGFRARVLTGGGGDELRMVVRARDVEVKVEVNQILRGVLNPVRPIRLVEAARHALRADVTLPVLHEDELYAGKLTAAMDRQHPRDLFDMAELYANGGIGSGVRRCFVAYLACHNRPLHEVLFAREKDIALAFEREFSGMTVSAVTLDSLLEVRNRLLRELPHSLDEDERNFLRSLVRAEPDYALLGFANLDSFPALRWKLDNLRRLRERDHRRFDEQAEALERGWQRLS
jgi:hypothetical protein